MPSFSTHENSHGDSAVIAVLKSAKIIEDPSSICAGFFIYQNPTWLPTKQNLRRDAAPQGLHKMQPQLIKVPVQQLPHSKT